jgi:outer membrane lipoprotein-sorting protein
MKRSRLILIMIGFFSAAAVPSTGSRANSKLDDILANMQKAASTITSINAKMVQARRDPFIGGAPEIYKGEVFFKHVAKGNDKFKVVYSIPPGQTIWVVGETITLYQAAINQAIITTRSAAASKGDEFAFIATPYTSVPELKRQYEIVYAGDEQGMAKLELTPKAKSSIRKLSWWVDQSSWLPVKSTVVEANGAPTTFTLSDVKKNQGVSDSTFKVDLPKGTRIVRR